MDMASASQPAVMESLRIPRLALVSAVALVFAGYLLQALTPIRLSPDVATYLHMARTASEGSGFHRAGQRTYFPVGYPGMIAGLIKLHLAHPWSLVVLNVLWLMVAAAGCWVLFRRSFRFSASASWLLVVVWLLSWPVAKHAAMALTDCSFLGAVMCALLAMDAGLEASSPRRAAWLAVVAAVFVAAGLSFRTAGVALLPALFLTSFRYWRRSQLDRRWRLPAVMMTFAVLGTLAVGLPLMGMYSVSAYSEAAVTRPGTVLDRVLFHALEMGSVATNLPSSVLGHLLPGFVTNAIGFSLALLVAAGFWARRRFQPADVFLLCYSALLVQWPYYEPRLLIPALPLFAAYGWSFVRTVKLRRFRVAMAGYLVLFIASGLLSLSYSIWLGSLRGARFAQAYGGGSEGNNYCAAFGDCPIDPSRPPAKPAYVDVLRFYR